MIHTPEVNKMVYSGQNMLTQLGSVIDCFTFWMDLVLSVQLHGMFFPVGSEVC